MTDQLDDVVELENPKAIRAIAHPARLIVIEALYDQNRELTATQAAQLAGTSPSAMSYHLRSLERFGIVQRAPATGDARERPWTRVAKDLRVRPDLVATSRALSLATSALLATAMDVTRHRLLSALERRDNDAAQPLDGVTRYMHTSVLVTAEEAQALLDSITKLVEPWRIEARGDAPDDAGSLTIVVAAVPDSETPGQRAPDETRS